MPELTNDQCAAVNVLEWLYSPNDDLRGAGRTTALAIAMIRLAARYPGLAVPIQDHAGERHATGVLTTRIQVFIQADPGLHDRIDPGALRLRHRLQFEVGTRPIPDWWPADWTRAVAQGPSRRPLRSTEPNALAPDLPTEASSLTLWDYLQDPTL